MRGGSATACGDVPSEECDGRQRGMPPKMGLVRPPRPKAPHCTGAKSPARRAIARTGGSAPARRPHCALTAPPCRRQIRAPARKGRVSSRTRTTQIHTESWPPGAPPPPLLPPLASCSSPTCPSRLARLKDQDGLRPQVEVDEVLGRVDHVRAEICADHDVPCRAAAKRWAACADVCRVQLEGGRGAAGGGGGRRSSSGSGSGGIGGERL